MLTRVVDTLQPGAASPAVSSSYHSPSILKMPLIFGVAATCLHHWRSLYLIALVIRGCPIRYRISRLLQSHIESMATPTWARESSRIARASNFEISFKFRLPLFCSHRALWLNCIIKAKKNFFFVIRHSTTSRFYLIKNLSALWIIKLKNTPHS